MDFPEVLNTVNNEPEKYARGQNTHVEGLYFIVESDECFADLSLVLYKEVKWIHELPCLLLGF